MSVRTALAEKISDLSRSGRALDIALGVLIAAVPLAYSPLAPNSLKWAILGLLTPLLTCLWLWGGSPPSFRPLPKLVAPFLALILVSQLSLLQAMNLYYGLQQVTHLVVLFLLYLIVAQTSSRPDQQARLVRYQLLTLLGVSVLSLLGCMMPGAHAAHSSAETLFRLFGNTNYGAAYLLTVIPLGLALTLAASERWERGLWGTTLFLSMVLLTLSMVRGAWVSIGIGLGVAVWVFFREGRSPGAFRNTCSRALIGPVVLAGSAILLATLLWRSCLPDSTSFGARVASVFDLQTGSLQVRLAMWQGTLRLIWDHLWTGVGVGNFALAFVPYRSAVIYQNPGMQVEHPHNELLNEVAELGPLGLLAFLWLFLSVVQVGWRLARRGEARREIVAGVLGGLAAAFAYTNLFYVLHVPASAMSVAILLGMLDGMDRRVTQDERGVPVRVAFLLPILVVMGLLGYHYFLRPMGGEIHYWLAEKDLKAKRVEAGLDRLERSIAWNPYAHVVRYRRAAVLFELGRYPETIEAAHGVLQVHPKLEIAYGLMGSAYLNLQETAKAEEIFRHAAALNPNYPHALNNLGVLAAQEGRMAEAEALLVRAREVLGQGEMSPYANLGNLYEMTGRLGDAIRMYETAVAIKPEFGANWYALARLRVQSGDPGGVSVALANAIALDPGWRARAAQDAVFQAVRQSDPQVRRLLQD
ncbi:MAG: O-antigen ligase family protein [Candidatus Methylomirabilales bacterium]